MRESWETTEGRGSVVKCGETLLENLKGDEVCGNSVGLSMNDGLTQTVGYIWANIWRMLNLILT